MIERANKMAQSSIHTSLGAQLFANARNTEIILQARLAQLRLQTIEYRDSSSQTRSDLEANHRVLGFRKSVLSNVNPAERYTPIAVVTATLPSGPSCLYTRPKRNSRTGPNPKRNLAEGDGGEEEKKCRGRRGNRTGRLDTERVDSLCSFFFPSFSRILCVHALTSEANRYGNALALHIVTTGRRPFADKV